MALIAGEVKYKLSSGATVGPYTAEYEDSDHYVDVRKPSPNGNYPTKLDFKKFRRVSSILFKPNTGGSETEWSSWTYFNHGQWVTDRFTNLS